MDIKVRCNLISFLFYLFFPVAVDNEWATSIVVSTAEVKDGREKDQKEKDFPALEDTQDPSDLQRVEIIKNI